MSAMDSGRVLVVSDEPDRDVRIQEALRGAGHDIVGEPVVPAACRLMRELPFDVIVTDMRTATADGLAIVRAASRAVPPARTVFLLNEAPSGVASPALEGIRRGAGICLPRECSTEALITAVAAALVPQTHLVESAENPIGGPDWRWAALTEAGQAVVRSLAVEDSLEAYRACARVALQRLGASAVWVMLPDAVGPSVTEVRRPGRSVPTSAPSSLAREAALVGRSIVRSEDDGATLVAAPVPGSSGSIGAIVAALDRYSPPASESAALLETLSVYVSLASTAGRRISELHNERAGAIAALCEALEARRPGSAERGERVARLASELAMELGLPSGSDDLRDIDHAARLHDLGSLGVPDTVLQSSSTLSPEGRGHVRRHPELAHRVAGAAPFLREPARLLRAARERWDGSGYPAGLSGDDIPKGAQILALAEAWEAMRSERPFRAAMSEEEAWDEVQRGAETQFSSAVVEAFRRVITRRTQAQRPEVWRASA